MHIECVLFEVVGFHSPPSVNTTHIEHLPGCKKWEIEHCYFNQDVTVHYKTLKYFPDLTTVAKKHKTRLPYLIHSFIILENMKWDINMNVVISISGFRSLFSHYSVRYVDIIWIYMVFILEK